MEQEKNINKMGTIPVQRLMLSMGVPMIFSMMLQAFYNIVDSAFVSNMAQHGEAALTALTLAFPVQMVLVAFSVGSVVGANALLSRTLGEGNREKVNRVAGNAEFLSLVICVVSIAFGLAGVHAYVQSQSNNTLVIDMAISYLRICCCIPFGMVFFSCFEKLLQATGKSLFSTIAQVSGAVTNIILDPILIYGLFGCPALGVRGAAYATVLGQIVSCIVALFFHLAQLDFCRSQRRRTGRFPSPAQRHRIAGHFAVPPADFRSARRMAVRPHRPAHSHSLSDLVDIPPRGNHFCCTFLRSDAPHSPLKNRLHLTKKTNLMRDSSFFPVFAGTASHTAAQAPE